MKTRFIRYSAIPVSAMLVGMIGYASAQALPQNSRLVSASARLTQNLDSKNATAGEAVSAELTSKVKMMGSTELPKGSTLVGKVEQVQASNNDSPARLSIVFDQARLKNGQTIPIKATILAAYPENTVDDWADSDASGPMVGEQPHFISANEKVDQEPGTLGQVAMHSAVQSETSAVFTSKDRNIDLKRGTQLQIAISPAASSMG